MRNSNSAIFLLLTLFVATACTSGQRDARPFGVSANVDWDSIPEEFQGPEGWYGGFGGARFGLYGQNPVGYECTVGRSLSTEAELGSGDGIVVYSGNKLVPDLHKRIAVKNGVVASWDFILEDVKEPYHTYPRALIVAYTINHVDKDLRKSTRSRILVYEDQDDDKIIENHEVTKELSLPKGGIVHTLVFHEDKLYILYDVRRGDEKRYIIYCADDYDRDSIPDSAALWPLKEVEAKDVFDAGLLSYGFSFVDTIGPPESPRHRREKDARQALLDFIEPAIEAETDPPFFGYVEFRYPMLEGDDFIWLKGPANSPYAISTMDGDFLGKGKLDAKGFTKAPLLRRLRDDDAPRSSVVLNQYTDGEGVAAKGTPCPMMDGPLKVSVAGEKRMRVRGRNFTKDMKVYVKRGWEEVWPCKFTLVSAREVLVDTPNVTKALKPSEVVHLAFVANGKEVYERAEVAIDLQQHSVPTISPDFFRTKSFSLGEATTIPLQGWNINAHTRADLLYEDEVISLGVHFDLDEGRSGAVDIPKLLGRIPAGVKVALAIRGESQSIDEAQKFDLRVEEVKRISGVSIKGSISPLGGEVVIKGKGVGKYSALYQRDASGDERLVHGDGNARSRFRQGRGRVFSVRPVKGEAFKANSMLKLILRDIADTGPGMVVQVKVADFEPSKTSWISTKRVKGEGETRVIFRGGKGFKLKDRVVLLEHNGNEYPLPIHRQKRHALEPGVRYARDYYIDVPKLVGAKLGDEVTLWIRHKFQKSGGEGFNLSVE